MSRAALFAAVRPFAPGGKFDTHDVATLDGLADKFGLLREISDGPDAGKTITARIALELISHEAIVREAYRDSVGVWTWGVGVTSASGHSVERYKDAPTSIRACVEVYLWVLRNVYAPAVRAAFAGVALTEAQFGAALSFHYNTGAIGKADWVTSFKSGDIAAARVEFMNWRKPPEIVARREKERNLFFDGVWSNDRTAIVYPVRKPSYRPDFSRGERVSVSREIAAALASEDWQ